MNPPAPGEAGIPTALRLGVSGLQSRRASSRCESVGMLTVCDGWNSLNYQAPVLLFSIAFGLPVLFLPRGVQQTLMNLKSLAVVLSAVGHRVDSLQEPTVQLIGSDYSLIA